MITQYHQLLVAYSLHSQISNTKTQANCDN